MLFKYGIYNHKINIYLKKNNLIIKILVGLFFETYYIFKYKYKHNL